MNSSSDLCGSSVQRRGAIAVLVAVVMTTVLLFGTLAVDVGYIAALVTEMQNTADAGCMAGASALQEGEYDKINERALTIIAQNQKSQGFLALDDQIIQIGRWDTTTATFVESPADEIIKANAIRVVSVRNEVPLFFAAIAGRHTTNVAREAVSMISPTCGGVWGIESVDVPGNVVVDSYDSREGPFSPGLARDNGDVCSNGPLTVAGSVEIHGDTLGDPVTIKGGKAVVTGYVDQLEEPIEPPVVELGDVATNNDNDSIGTSDKGRPVFSSGWNLELKGNDNLTLPPGTFYFESVRFGKNSTLSISGPTTIYLSGNFDETGQGVMNTTTQTHDLTIYSVGPKVHITGGAQFSGTIIAPNSEVLLAGNADFHGALIGGDVKMAGNFNFHVDESLPLVHSLKPPPRLVR